MVFRIHKTDDYTTMSNYHFKDKALSLKAKGLLSLMLSLPKDWDYSIRGLSVLSSDGESSVRSGLQELEKRGYLIRKQIHLNGVISDWEYNIFEMPQDVENQDVENQQLDNRRQYNTNISNTKIINTHTTNVVCQPQAVEQQFFIQEPTKQPKKNLYQKCMDAIDEFTDDDEVRDKLKEFLGVRLERKDTPMGIKAFQGMLKKLRELTESKAECLQIIQQSIDRSYLSFFPLLKRQPYKKKTGKDVEIMSLNGDAVKVSDSEKEEMRRLVESGEIEEY